MEAETLRREVEMDVERCSHHEEDERSPHHEEDERCLHHEEDERSPQEGENLFGHLSEGTICRSFTQCFIFL